MIYEPDSSRGSTRVHKAACLQTDSLCLSVSLNLLLYNSLLFNEFNLNILQEKMLLFNRVSVQAMSSCSALDLDYFVSFLLMDGFFSRL